LLCEASAPEHLFGLSPYSCEAPLDPKDDPYRLQPPTKLVREEQKLIQLRDDSVVPPSSVGVDTFQAIFFGAPALQPSKAEEKPKGVSFGVGLMLLLFLIPILLAIKKYIF